MHEILISKGRLMSLDYKLKDNCFGILMWHLLKIRYLNIESINKWMQFWFRVIYVNYIIYNLTKQYNNLFYII